MSGILGDEAEHQPVIFKASIASATLPTITTSSVPVGRVWIAHGTAKLVEAATFSIGATNTDTGSVTSSYNTFAVESGAEGAVDSGTEGAADSGTSGGIWCNHGGRYYRAQGCARYCAHYCSRWCAHYCARYCARYCGLGGYGYGFGYGHGFGFGYGYGTARGFSAKCTAVAVAGSASWTQVIPAGFSVTSWLYYEEEETD